MRLSRPRVQPIDPSLWDKDINSLAITNATNTNSAINIFATLANHPKLLKRWLVFGNHVLFKSSLPARDREIIILRIGWLCQSEYEWGQHVVIGRQSGLSNEEISRIADGPDSQGWNSSERALIRAVDELYTDSFVSEGTWSCLKDEWSTQQLIDILFTVGQYNLVSMVLNSLGVQLEDGIEGFTETTKVTTEAPR